MAEMKNICGKIPLELHEKVREEIELTESSTQRFIQQVIEEHFMKKGESQMTARTLAVQVTEELFGRMKKVVARKGCKQKDFLIGIIEKALEEEERKFQLEDEETGAESEEDAETAEDQETEDAADAEESEEESQEEEETESEEGETAEEAEEAEEADEEEAPDAETAEEAAEEY